MIGIFDSGSGGLSVLSEIRERLPTVDIVYLGDIKNAPYGSKAKEELQILTAKVMDRLLAEGATSLVSACNSVSTTIVLPMLENQEKRPFEIIEMVGPTVRSLDSSKQKVLLVATPATIESGTYQQAFRSMGRDFSAVAIDRLAGMIEFGYDEEEIERTIKEAVVDRLEDNSILLLGCTHYPLVKNLFEKVIEDLNKKVEIINPAAAVAEEVKLRMLETGYGRTRFLISQDSKTFRGRVKQIFGEDNIIIEVI